MGKIFTKDYDNITSTQPNIQKNKKIKCKKNASIKFLYYVIQK